jgi:hypothetical protein
LLGCTCVIEAYAVIREGLLQDAVAKQNLGYWCKPMLTAILLLCILIKAVKSYESKMDVLRRIIGEVTWFKQDCTVPEFLDRDCHVQVTSAFQTSATPVPNSTGHSQPIDSSF